MTRLPRALAIILIALAILLGVPWLVTWADDAFARTSSRAERGEG